jgi:lauroyl-Kdo2-lipid IVA myristoyltransferase
VFHRRLLAPRFWGTWLAAVLCGLLAVVPIRVRAIVATGLARIIVRLPGARLRVARINLQLCFPSRTDAAREAMLRRHVLVLCNVFLDYGRMMFGSPAAVARHMDVTGMEHVEALQRSGRNVILFTPHTAALEHAGIWLSLHVPILGIVRLHDDNDALDWLVTRMRTRHQGHVVSHLAGMHATLRSVRSGYWLFYAPDDDQASASLQFADFYGVPRGTPATLGRLAQAGRAVVLPVMSGYDPKRRRFWIHVQPPRDWQPAAEPAAEAAQVNALLQLLIKLDPDQYLWSEKIFRARPAGVAKRY